MQYTKALVKMGKKMEHSAGRRIKRYNYFGKLAVSDMHLSYNLAISPLYIQEK